MFLPTYSFFFLHYCENIIKFVHIECVLYSSLICPLPCVSFNNDFILFFRNMMFLDVLPFKC